MQLDFLTLYVIILLNSLSLAVIWAAIVAVYRSFVAARFWLASLLMTCIGGVLLAADGASAPAVPTFVGMGLIGAGFGVMWQGVRVFFGKKPVWYVLGILVALSAIGISIVGTDRAQQNVVYATIQIIPISLAAVTLLFARPWKLGALVAAGAAGIAVAGHTGEVLTNLARMAGAMSTDEYYDFAAWFLVATIIGGSVWNLGFLLMAIDRLNFQLSAIATTDDLTGLCNRRGLRQRLRAYVMSERGRQAGAAVVMMDLDRFKAINDRHGHAAGNACLVHVASLANNLRRTGDLLARLSGDEFCLILPGADIDAAEAIANRLTKVVSSTPLVWRGRQVSLSVSTGVGVWRSDKGDMSDAFDDADRALYKAKRAGREDYPIDNSHVSANEHNPANKVIPLHPRVSRTRGISS